MSCASVGRLGGVVDVGVGLGVVVGSGTAVGEGVAVGAVVTFGVEVGWSVGDGVGVEVGGSAVSLPPEVAIGVASGGTVTGIAEPQARSTRGSASAERSFFTPY
jgi:hypothetical protein